LRKGAALFARFLEFVFAFGPFIDNFRPGLVLQLLPLLALVLRAQAADAEAGLAVELANADAGRINCHINPMESVITFVVKLRDAECMKSRTMHARMPKT
jgi:hypothetical protein